MKDLSHVTEEYVKKIIMKLGSNICCLDPKPTALVKECLDVLLPIITIIINQSFSSAHFPKSLKLVAVTPIVKMANLIAEILQNFQSTSNLLYLSKVLEKVVAK